MSEITGYHKYHVELLQCITRVLEQLASSGKIREKVYGKQKVYVVDQVNFLTLNNCLTVMHVSMCGCTQYVFKMRAWKLLDFSDCYIREYYGSTVDKTT